MCASRSVNREEMDMMANEDQKIIIGFMVRTSSTFHVGRIGLILNGLGVEEALNRSLIKIGLCLLSFHATGYFRR